jgi:kumamolisin
VGGIVNSMALTARPHPRRRRTIALVILLLALGTGGAALLLNASQGGPPPAVQETGPAPASERIDFTLVLRLRGSARLQAALAALEDPRSAAFRRLIDARSFGRRYGLSLKQLVALRGALRDAGLSILTAYPQRTALRVSATAAAVQRLLQVRIRDYRDRAGHLAHAPVGTPRIPSQLAGVVSSVTGLDTRPRFHFHDVPIGGLTPQETATAYDVGPLAQRGVLGQGQTIAVISFSDYDRGDPSGYATRFGIRGPDPQVIPVDGGTTDTSGATEANLDIDVIRAVAPLAQILVYEAPQSSGAYTDVINRIVADRRAEIVSTSWGQCELNMDSGQRAGDSQAIRAADAAGVSLFAATGDRGAYDCQDGDLTDHRLSVDWPAASAGVVAVGGTRLYLNSDGSYGHEAGWEDALSAAGGGGGLTTGDPRPPWQSGPGVSTPYSNGRRQLPDVSADADPATGWVTYSGGNYGEAGGTSAAAPFWAASMLLVRQYAAQQGVGRLGFVDPMLYALAAASGSPFHDVTLGGNRFFQATPGWDPTTGLGSPDVYNLARATVAYLRIHPSASVQKKR